VLAGVASGVLGLVSTTVASLWFHPQWQAGVAVAMTVASGALLGVSLTPAAPSVRRDRLGDLAEFAAMASLLPLLVLTAGGPELTRDLPW
jgi:zinc transporter ZupT